VTKVTNVTARPLNVECGVQREKWVTFLDFRISLSQGSVALY